MIRSWFSTSCGFATPVEDNRCHPRSLGSTIGPLVTIGPGLSRTGLVTSVRRGRAVSSESLGIPLNRFRDQSPDVQAQTQLLVLIPGLGDDGGVSELVHTRGNVDAQQCFIAGREPADAEG